MNFEELKSNLNTLNRESRIDELESIKAELDKIYQEEIKNDSRWSAGVKYSCKIIDNRIEELKGESE